MEKLILLIVLCIAAVIASGCVSSKEIKAEVWLNSGLPASLCTATPELQRYGSYRRLNDEACKEAGKPPGCVEFMGYCRQEYKDWVSMSKTKFSELLKKYLPTE